MTELQTTFLTRLCHVRKGNHDSELSIQFFLPEKIAEQTWLARAKLECIYFSKIIEVQGSDGAQALTCLLDPVKQYLKRQEAAHGLSMWWLAPGDLSFSDFWSYSP